MRLAPTPTKAAACLATLCFATTATTTTTAFFVSPSTLSNSLSSARGGPQRQSARCTSPVPLKMATPVPPQGDASCDFQKGSSSSYDTDGEVVSKRIALRSKKIFGRRRDSEGEGNAAVGDGVIREGRWTKQRARRAARKSFAAVATAIIVRASLKPLPASAIMTPRLGGRKSAHQKMVEKEHKAERDRIAALREKELQEEQAATELSGEGKTETDTDGNASGGVGSEGVSGGDGPVPRSSTGEIQLTDGQRALIAERRNAMRQVASNAPVREMKMTKLTAGLLGSWAVYNIISSFKGSTAVMGKQRRRVKVESAKFDQQKEEFMNVDGEAEVDVDIMKELRDMKEKMAGPRDKYAKDTRKYNPEFAAEHREEDYDAKLEEALRKKNAKGKNAGPPKLGKTGIVFTSDTSDTTVGEGDDLLGENTGDKDAAQSKSESQSSTGAGATPKAKKDADVKRLQDLFNNSPNDDSDAPEDDIADKRDLLP